jgi:protein CsiD
MRFVLADRLDRHVGDRFRQAICDILLDRDSGGFTLGVQDVATKEDELVKFATAVSHLAGPANRDAMSGSYFARFVVKHSVEGDSYLRHAYRNLALHTDGTYVEEATDWLLMMKLGEHDAEGGESRLLHLDDWQDLDCFHDHPLGSQPFAFKGSASKNVDRVVRRPLFFRDGSGICISYIDQFVHPENLEQARLLFEISQSLETCPKVGTPKLPVGNLIMLNNRFWLHGRAAFRPNERLHRELLRQRGVFAIGD